MKIPEIDAVTRAHRTVQRLPMRDAAARLAADGAQGLVSLNVLLGIFRMPRDFYSAELVVSPDSGQPSAQRAVAADSLLRGRGEFKAHRTTVTSTGKHAVPMREKGSSIGGQCPPRGAVEKLSLSEVGPRIVIMIFHQLVSSPPSRGAPCDEAERFEPRSLGFASLCTVSSMPFRGGENLPYLAARPASQSEGHGTFMPLMTRYRFGRVENSINY